MPVNSSAAPAAVFLSPSNVTEKTTAAIIVMKLAVLMLLAQCLNSFAKMAAVFRPLGSAIRRMTAETDPTKVISVPKKRARISNSPVLAPVTVYRRLGFAMVITTVSIIKTKKAVRR